MRDDPRELLRWSERHSLNAGHETALVAAVLGLHRPFHDQLAGSGSVEWIVLKLSIAGKPLVCGRSAGATRGRTIRILVPSSGSLSRLSRPPKRWVTMLWTI